MIHVKDLYEYERRMKSEHDIESEYMGCMRQFCQTLIENEKSPLHQEVETLFFVYTYVDPETFMKHATILFNGNILSTYSKTIFRERFMVYVYMKMVKETSDGTWDMSSLADLRSASRVIGSLEKTSMYESQKSMVQKLLEHRWIKNSDISFYDLFVHASYVMENPILGHFMLEILPILYDNTPSWELEAKGIEPSDDHLFSIDSLYQLSEYCKDYHMDIIDQMDDDLEKYNYKYTYIYFLNKHYLMLKRFILLDTSNSYSIHFISNFPFHKIKNIILHIDAHIQLDDILEWIHDMMEIDEEPIYEHGINAFIHSIQSPIAHAYIVSLWCRSIYGRNHMVKYDEKMDTYEKDGKVLIFEEYVKTIYDTIQSYPRCVSEYLMRHICDYVDWYQNRRMLPIVEHVDCAICMESEKSGNIWSQCVQCKHIFHESCVKELFKIHHRDCPLCRSSLYQNVLINVDIRYRLFSAIVNEHRE